MSHNNFNGNHNENRWNDNYDRQESNDNRRRPVAYSSERFSGNNDDEYGAAIGKKDYEGAVSSSMNENYGNVSGDGGARYLHENFTEVSEPSGLVRQTSGLRRRSESDRQDRFNENMNLNRRSFNNNYSGAPPAMARAASEMIRSDVQRTNNRNNLNSFKSQSTTDFRMSKMRNNDGKSDLNRFRDSSDLEESAEGLGIGAEPYPSMRNSGKKPMYSSHSPTTGPSNNQNISRRPSAIHNPRPNKKEATPIMPPSLAAEPSMPRPRVSRRFLRYTQQERQVDFAIAVDLNDPRYNPGDYSKYNLKCPNCFTNISIPKMAVLMQCPACGAVSPATSIS